MKKDKIDENYFKNLIPSDIMEELPKPKGLKQILKNCSGQVAPG